MAEQLIIAFFLASGISIISYYLKLLSLSGAAAAFFLAFLIFGFGGWMWTVPIFTFFILSSFLSKLRAKKNISASKHFEKQEQRDYLQVLANGGAGGILVIFFYLTGMNIFYIAFVSLLAAVCADTWGTEIGTIMKTKTYNILSFKEIEQGLSGGISVIGLTGSLLGAFVIALSSIAWINFNIVSYICLITLAGFLGSIFDSVLGASIQAQRKCVVCSQITERKIHCGEESILVRGKNFINNDFVNFLTGIFGGLAGVFFYELSGI